MTIPPGQKLGAFVPLSRNTHGQLIREVAPARISLPREDHLTTRCARPGSTHP